MRWARVRIPRKTSEAVRIWQCKWSHFRNLTVSVMGVVRGWHHLTFAAAVPYVPPALNHCARSETIKTTLRDWRCRPPVTGILRVRQLQSQWLHHDSWKDCCCQSWQAVCIRAALRSFPRGTSAPFRPEQEDLQRDLSRSPAVCLWSNPVAVSPSSCHALAPSPDWMLSDSLQTPNVFQPQAHCSRCSLCLDHLCTCLPFSFLIISAQRSPPGSKCFLWPPKWKWYLPTFHVSITIPGMCVCLFLWPWNLFLYLSSAQFLSLEHTLTSLSPTPGTHRRCSINIWSM